MHCYDISTVRNGNILLYKTILNSYIDFQFVKWAEEVGPKWILQRAEVAFARSPRFFLEEPKFLDEGLKCFFFFRKGVGGSKVVGLK